MGHRGRHRVDDKDREPCQFRFDGFVKVDFQGSRVTSDAGLMLVRELDERLGLGKLIDEHLTDIRQAENTKFPLADLLRQSGLGRAVAAQDRAPTGRRQAGQLPRRCRLRQTRDLRGIGRARRQVRHLHSSEQEPKHGDRRHPLPAAGQTLAQTAGALEDLSLSRRELAEAPLDRR